MKKLIIIVALLAMLAPLAVAQSYQDFLASAVALNASATKVNVSDFTSLHLSGYFRAANNVTLTVTFTRAAGSATLTVDYYFQVSYDGGTTWSDFHDPFTDAEYFSVLTGHSVISGTTVRVSRIIPLSGATHVRLSKLINNDSGNNLTAVNATISW